MNPDIDTPINIAIVVMLAITFFVATYFLSKDSDLYKKENK